MADVLVNESSLEDIADAIRSKNGLTTKYKPAEMADAISAISGGGITPTGTKQINITQNGTVTEDVTNYASAEITANVPNSYSASDEGKVVDNGALAAQTSQNITANGTYDTTTKNSVNVNVPQGITPSGSQTFTQNGTYDVTSLAQAVVNVASSGVHTEEGYVELSDTATTSITIPVDVTEATGFVATLYVVETGEVSGGVVTKYENAEIPTQFSSGTKNFAYGYMMKYPKNPVPAIYRDSTNLVSTRSISNTIYNYAYRGNNGGNTTLNANPTIDANGVTLTTSNANRYFCVAGAYVKFKYEITWW